MFSEKLDELVKENINTYKKKALSDQDFLYTYVGTETIGEVIEKLLILNIRVWILEDLAAEAKLGNNDFSYTELKKKLDVCFKIKRPKLVTVLNQMFKMLQEGNEGVCEDGNIKLYKHE